MKRDLLWLFKMVARITVTHKHRDEEHLELEQHLEVQL